MRGRGTRAIAAFSLVVGLLAAFSRALAEAPPLRSIAPEAFADNPAGIKAGGLVYHSSLASALIYDSNLLSSHTDVISDQALLLRPGISISTIDPNYKFTFRSFLESLQYQDMTSENRMNYGAELDGKIRLQRDLQLATFVSAGRVDEPRSLARRDLPDNAAGPISYNQYFARASLVHTWAPFVTTTTIGYENENYFNVAAVGGGTLNLQYLDRDVLVVTQAEDMVLSPRLRLFAKQSLIVANYQQVPGYVERDSVKFELTNGVEVGLTPLIKARFVFRFAEEHFKDDSIQAEPELNYAADISWMIKRYVRLFAGVGRDFGGVNFQLDTQGGSRTRADIGIDYEITRRFFVRSSLAYLFANDNGVSSGVKRLEHTYVYRAGLAYQLDRFWTLFADYCFETRETNITDDQFERHVAQAGLVARF